MVLETQGVEFFGKKSFGKKKSEYGPNIGFFEFI